MTTNDTSEKPDFLYGADEIAAELGVTPKIVYHMIAERRIPFGKIGRKVYATRSALDQWRSARMQWDDPASA
jgi:excisionase family DNA binding protein